MPASVMPDQGWSKQHAEGGTAYGQVAGRNHARKAVPCVVDGVLYPSAGAAAKALGLSQPGLSKALRHGDAEYRGHSIGGTRIVGTAPRPEPAEPEGNRADAPEPDDAPEAAGPEEERTELPAQDETPAPQVEALPEEAPAGNEATEPVPEPAAETNWERFFCSPRKAARMQIERWNDIVRVKHLGEVVAEVHVQGLLDWMEAIADDCDSEGDAL